MDTKFCPDCKEEKPKNLFLCKANGKISFRRFCNSCRSKQWRLYKKTEKKQIFPKPEKLKIVPKLKNHKPYFDVIKNGWFKFCLPCEQIKPVEEFKLSKGVPQCCKLCWNERQKKYYRQMLPDKKIARHKRIKESMNNEQKKALKIYQRNYRKTYLKKNPERQKAAIERQREVRRNQTKEQKRAYREKYASVINKNIAAYRARRKGAKIVIRFTKADIIKRDGLNCYLCGKLLNIKEVTIDHILPLVRGGNHKPENAKIACRSCNSSKYKKTLTEFKKHRGDYDRFTVKI